MQDRVIFHCDCNSFYASVELLDHPELQSYPVAVSGSVNDRHGIILAKNEAAKKYKIQTAETVWQAKKKCPNLILLQPHHKLYRQYSKIINDIYGQYTDRVEAFGIDESWLDMTGSWQLFGRSPQEVADKLRERVKTETKLTISVGVSFNKVFAKLGSDYKKPDATTVIAKNTYKEILWPLPVSAMLYIGDKSRSALEGLGINTIGQLAQFDKNVLQQVLGKQGVPMHLYANGEDDSPVARAGEHEPVKSVGNGLTFRRNLVGRRDVRIGLGALADEVATRLRNKGLYANTVSVQIKNPELKSISRQKQLSYATNLSSDIINATMELIEDNWDLSKPIRMLTVTAQNLSDMPFMEQTNLFGEVAGPDAKREKLEKSIDAIRHRYGSKSVVEAGRLRNDLGLDADARPDTEPEDS